MKETLDREDPIMAVFDYISQKTAMTFSSRFFRETAWIVQALTFFKRHLPVILGLGLVAAFGRAAQLGAFGEVSSGIHTSLEIAIQVARIGIFIYTLGLTNVKRGFLRIRLLLTSLRAWKENVSMAIRKIKNDWSTLLVSMIVYLLIALAINALIDYTTYQTCLYYKLKANEIISNKASEWVIILFLKNLSVIPFTLVFNALFLLWITNKNTLVPQNQS